MSERIFFNACPLCEHPHLFDAPVGNCSAHPLFHASLHPLIQWKRCANCQHVFTEGYYNDEICQLIYSKTNPHQQVGHEFEHHRIISSRMVEKVLPYVAGGAWLDVGFGNGSLLFTAQEYGFTPIGLDVRKDNVDALLALDIEAYTEDITRLALSQACSVISMADVLEHIPYPGIALKASHALLAADGVLFVSMPNTESMVWKILDQGNINPYWGEIEHYHNFSRTRLYSLLREYGFEPLRYGISERYRSCMEVIAKKIV